MLFNFSLKLLAFALAVCTLCAMPQFAHAGGAVLNAKACTLTVDGKTYPLQGKYQVVESFPDFKVQIVTSFSDLNVQQVSSFPSSCGKWQQVTSFPDFKIQWVSSFPDLKISFVESFPGTR